MAVKDLVDDELECEPIKAAVAAGGIRDIRQGPRSGGTSFVLLHYLTGAARGSIRQRGWWANNADDFITAVTALGRRHGVATRTSAEVARVVVKDDTVSGVVLASGEEIGVPLVISTADPARTLLGLVDPVWLDPDLLHALRNIKYRGCTAVVQYALDALPDVRGLGSAELASVVSLSDNLDALERAYDAAKYGGVSGEPHVEISVPSLRWPSLAPAGKHVMIARAQYVPHLPNDGPWTAQRASLLGDAVTSAIARVIPRFRESVLQRNVLTPSDLETQFGMTDGALTHGELTLDQILFMRPVAGLARYETPIAGLYLAGSGSHPGPGMLGAPGWLAAKMILSSRAKVS
jgi:phytoene dehydrogenase-like protein